jgi:hypothetical protein
MRSDKLADPCLPPKTLQNKNVPAGRGSLVSVERPLWPTCPAGPVTRDTARSAGIYAMSGTLDEFSVGQSGRIACASPTMEGRRASRMPRIVVHSGGGMVRAHRPVDQGVAGYCPRVQLGGAHSCLATDTGYARDNVIGTKGLTDRAGRSNVFERLNARIRPPFGLWALKGRRLWP